VAIGHKEEDSGWVLKNLLQKEGAEGLQTGWLQETLHQTTGNLQANMISFGASVACITPGAFGHCVRPPQPVCLH
jgi:hypothetical protein